MAHRYRRSTARPSRSLHPIVPFLIIASFGILFVGCSGPEDVDDTLVFTDDDAAIYRQLADSASGSLTASGSEAVDVEPLDSASGSDISATADLDLSMVDTYAAAQIEQDLGSVLK